MENLKLYYEGMPISLESYKNDSIFLGEKFINKYRSRVIEKVREYEESFSDKYGYVYRVAPNYFSKLFIFPKSFDDYIQTWLYFRLIYDNPQLYNLSFEELFEKKRNKIENKGIISRLIEKDLSDFYIGNKFEEVRYRALLLIKILLRKKNKNTNIFLYGHPTIFSKINKILPWKTNNLKYCDIKFKFVQ